MRRLITAVALHLGTATLRVREAQDDTYPCSVPPCGRLSEPRPLGSLQDPPIGASSRAWAWAPASTAGPAPAPAQTRLLLTSRSRQTCKLLLEGRFASPQRILAQWASPPAAMCAPTHCHETGCIGRDRKGQLGAHRKGEAHKPIIGYPETTAGLKGVPSFSLPGQSW